MKTLIALVASLAIITGCGTLKSELPPVVYDGEAAQLLYTLSNSYNRGDAETFLSVFDEESSYRKNSTISVELAKDVEKELTFTDITTREDGSGAAWFTAQTDSYCGGLAEWKIEKGKISEFNYRCYEDQIPIEGSTAAQIADAAVSLSILSGVEGAVEINPIMAIEPTVMLPAKILVSELVEYYEPKACREVKKGMSIGGMAGTIGGVCTLSGAAIPICLAAGYGIGWAWSNWTEQFQAEACKSESISYVLIDKEQIVALQE